MYSAKAVANYFLDKGDAKGVPISPMKVIKLVYVAHGWSLALTGKALINEIVEAWAYGPVIPEIYHAFKEFVDNPITNRAYLPEGLEVSPTDIIDNDKFTVGELLDLVWDNYKDFTALELSDLTHREGTPWHTISKKWTFRLIKHTPIRNEDIRDYYVSLMDKESEE